MNWYRQYGLKTSKNFRIQSSDCFSSISALLFINLSVVIVRMTTTRNKYFSAWSSSAKTSWFFSICWSSFLCKEQAKTMSVECTRQSRGAGWKEGGRGLGCRRGGSGRMYRHTAYSSCKDWLKRPITNCLNILCTKNLLCRVIFLYLQEFCSLLSKHTWEFVAFLNCISLLLDFIYWLLLMLLPEKNYICLLNDIRL